MNGWEAEGNFKTKTCEVCGADKNLSIVVWCHPTTGRVGKKRMTLCKECADAELEAWARSPDGTRKKFFG